MFSAQLELDPDSGIDARKPNVVCPPMTLRHVTLVIGALVSRKSDEYHLMDRGVETSFCQARLSVP